MAHASPYRGRKVLVTGGTGEIGEALVRAVLREGAQVVRVFDHDETRSHWLREDLGDPPEVRYLLGSVRDRERLRRAMEGVDVVLHAAALKHVPLCEYNPFEAVQTNVVGTQHVIEAAVDAGVRRVIAISTDKAVDPTSTMGATKLLAEKVVAAANQFTARTVFTAVRFGNVLASRGSVVPHWERQIHAGGPVSLTDLGMTRFMMSVAEAARLVLRAGARARGGEVFILRMPALRLSDLARVLVEALAPAYGHDPARVEVEVTGRRAGERLGERLLSPEELPRVRVLRDMFVVEPAWRKLPAGEATRAPPRREWDSEEAQLLDREAIRRLLRSARVIG
ncbi:MAG: SDR family NAD(P)-dependent oxidoreductase [Planctomycetes bacterium]|nr:SDR family NAD(P)-dependent oxidoreductase [Planctomycetota bacterium]